VRVRQALEAVGEALGDATADQVALAWLLAHPSGIVPVLGTGKRERIRAAAGAAKLSLSREQWFSIWIASAGSGVP
jgi:predicted oxidoreductase